ncbi:transcription termination factor Rho [soil metagenome]
MDRSVLSRKPMTELKDIAAHLNMRGYQKLRKAELIDAIISSGSASAGDPGGASGEGSADDGASDGAQQRLDTGSGESRAAREAREAREESARKVLPPSSRAAAAGEPEGGSDIDADDGGSEADGATAADGDGDRNGQAGERSRTRTRDGDRGPSRERTRGGDRDGERTGDGEPSGDAGQSGGRRQLADDGGRSQSADDDDDGDEDAASRKRRNRRDRRKRNRDRQSDEEQTPAQGGGANDPGEVRAGVLDILPEGYGFLRTTGYLPGERDVYVSQGQIRKHGLRRGDVVQGPIRQQRSNEKVPALHHVQRVNGDPLEDGQVPERPDFEDLTAIHPDERVVLVRGEASLTARLVDLIAPLGRGQRALITAPPRAGKTALLRELGQALSEASPDSHLMVVMVDERPEEISEMARAINGEVISSTFDRAAEDHAQIAELAIERARRLVELGHDVIVLLDSITRLARAYNVTVQGNGRSIAPGVDATALQSAKRVFAAARNTDEGGSLTLVATALRGADGSPDQVILEEFSRVANTVIAVDPTLVGRRVHPPISVHGSGTDNEAGLQDADELVIIHSLRRTLEGLPDDAATELLLDKLAQTDSADQLLAQIRDSV